MGDSSDENPMMALLKNQSLISETESNETEEQPLSLSNRQSSYANLRLKNGLSDSHRERKKLEVRAQSIGNVPFPKSFNIVTNSKNSTITDNSNPIIVLGNGSDDDDDDNDAPITLGVRQVLLLLI